MSKHQKASPENHVYCMPVNPQINVLSANLNINQKQNKNRTPFGSGLWFLNKLIFFFWKFKYNGKGLKIKKSKLEKQILFNLGMSHPSKFYYNPTNLIITRTKKNTFVLYSSLKVVKVYTSMLEGVRLYNKYTKRGLRLSRQAVPRRFGKVSQLGAKKK